MGVVSALGLSTALELRLAIYGVILAAIAGSYAYTHHEGFEACERPNKAALAAQNASDKRVDAEVTHESKTAEANLVAPGGPAATPPPSLPLCLPSRAPLRSAAPAAQPLPPATAGGDRGVPGGGEAGPAVDVGPVVQDLALAGVLGATNGRLLWKRATDQSQAVKP